MSSAIFCPPPWPKMSASWLQLGQTKWLMFSMMPSVGMFSFWYIADRAAAVGQRHLLRRRDDDRSGDRNRLAQAQRDVAGARRHVDDEVVEIVPAHLAEELLDGAVQHRPAPDDRRVVRRHEPHRDHLEPVLLGRHDLLAVGRELRA